MKKGRFLWSAHRITEKQKAGKARNIKEKQLKNSRSTASKPPVVRLSSANADFISKTFKSPGKLRFSGAAFLLQLLETDSLGTGKNISGLQPRCVTVEERGGVCSVR